MRFTAKTEYGVICLIYMARRGGLKVDPVTIREIATAEKFSLTYTEKILQNLRTAGIVAAQHGNQGGYVLARQPSEITFKEIVEALEGHTFDVFCEPEIRKEITCTHFSLCGVKPVWQKTKDILDQFYGSITLDMMAKNQFNFDTVKS
jgi:Rrf2 family transcriptional regulator, iron-sulfur cluster assembly transcription factor